MPRPFLNVLNALSQEEGSPSESLTDSSFFSTCRTHLSQPTPSDDYLTNKEYHQDIYAALRQRELDAPTIRPHFLQSCMLGIETASFMRRAAILRARVASDALQCKKETFHLAAHYMDAIWSTLQLCEREAFFQVAAVSLVTASKCEEYSSIRFSKVARDGICEITNVSVRELAQLEDTFLHALNWRLTVATPYTFTTYMHTVVAESTERCVELSDLLIFLAVLDDRSREWKNFEVAYAAVLVSNTLVEYSKVFYEPCSLQQLEAKLSARTKVREGATRPLCLKLVKMYEKTLRKQSYLPESIPLVVFSWEAINRTKQYFRETSRFSQIFGSQDLNDSLSTLATTSTIYSQDFASIRSAGSTQDEAAINAKPEKDFSHLLDPFGPL
ncbi:unnamed protein product, partial [Mesorhabditis spiculigera]